MSNVKPRERQTPTRPPSAELREEQRDDDSLPPYDVLDPTTGEVYATAPRSGPEDVDRAASHQAQLEKLMLAAGGIAGPGSIGSMALDGATAEAAAP